LTRYRFQSVRRPWAVTLLFLLSAGTPLLATAILPTPASAQSAVASLIQRGYTQLSQGLVAQAIATFERALQQSPNSIEAKLGLAIGYAREGKDEAAWEAYQRVLAQDGRNRLALQAIGKLGGFRPAWQAQGIAALTTLLELDPTDREARTNRATLYRYQSRFSEAIGDYQMVLQVANPPAEALLGAAQAYTYSGNPGQGLALFQRYQSVSGSAIGKDAAIAVPCGRRAMRISRCECWKASCRTISTTSRCRCGANWPSPISLRAKRQWRWLCSIPCGGRQRGDCPWPEP
jgi:cellulose synthase operon protein C